MRIELTLNGRPAVWEIEPGERLLDALRRHGVYSVKRGCETGDCGACVALLDGEPVSSCVVAAARARGAQVVTLEGLAGDPLLERVREAFLAEGAVQCGYCTPGMLIVAWHLLREGGKVDEVTVRQALSGSLCRCTGYVKPVRAVLLAAQREKVIAHGHAPSAPAAPGGGGAAGGHVQAPLGGPAAGSPGHEPGSPPGGQPGGPAASTGGERP